MVPVAGVQPNALVAMLGPFNAVHPEPASVGSSYATVGRIVLMAQTSSALDQNVQNNHSSAGKTELAYREPRCAMATRTVPMAKMNLDVGTGDVSI